MTNRREPGCDQPAIDPSPLWAGIKLDHAAHKEGGDDRTGDVWAGRGGEPRALALDRRLTKPTTTAVTDVLSAARAAGLSLRSSETPSHLMDLPGKKYTPSTCAEIFAESNLLTLPSLRGEYRRLLSC